MPQTDIASATATDYLNSIVDYSVESETTDGPQGDIEFRWQMDHWNDYLGYYKKIPELQTAIDTKANWTVGAGYEAEEPTDILLSGIKGNGKDSFNTILANMVRTYIIGGDSFAEIIRDDDGVFINLKPLDPSSIVVVSNKKGQITRYEQTTKNKNPNHKFTADEILHLSRKRLADEVHGESVIKVVENIILMRNEAMTDWQRVLHRNVDPMWVYHLDTDDTTEITNFKTKIDTARKNGESMFVPKGVVVPELISTATNASLNPLTWINQLNDYFFQAVGVPQIIIGNAKEFTDASGKIVYLAFEQSVKGEQLYIEEQILGQINIELKLTFPASLQNEALNDSPSPLDLEEEPIEEPAQPNDQAVELEGKA